MIARYVPLFRLSISCCAVVFYVLLLAPPGIWAQPCQQFPAQIAAAPDDTSKVILLDNFVKCLNDVNADSALAVNRRAIDLAERRKDEKLIPNRLVRSKSEPFLTTETAPGRGMADG